MICKYIGILLFILTGQITSLYGQLVNIPDVNFRSFLQTNYPSVMVGSQLDTVAAATVSGTLNCRSKNISDITGIQYFKSITTIQLGNNNLSSLPLLTGITNLQRLFCDTNQIASLPPLNNTIQHLGLKKNLLTAIPSLTGLNNLIYLECSFNLLTQLPDLSSQINLEQLYCTNNLLTQLPNFSTLVGLRNFNCNINQISQLPDVSACTNLQIFACSDNLITQLPDFSSCTGLTSLVCSNNLLTQLPDLSLHTSLDILYCNNNQLTQLPDLSGKNMRVIGCSDNFITQLPDFSASTNLISFRCAHNMLTTLPSFAPFTNLSDLDVSFNQFDTFPNLSTCTNLKTLIAAGNNFTSLPDMSFLNLPFYVYFYYNYLTFEDFLPLVTVSNFATAFVIVPQKNFGNYPDSTVILGSNYTLNLGIDGAVSGNTYKWYHNNVLDTTTTVNTLTWNNFAEADTGSYYVIVKNSHPSLVNDSIRSNTFKLSGILSPGCLDLSNMQYTVESISCQEGNRLTINESTIMGGVPPYGYNLSNNITGELYSNYTSNVLTGVKEGEYFLTIEDILSCTTTIGPLQVETNEDCDPVFSPNGDGIADTYFISIPGKAMIYNREGKLVEEFSTPNYWDGLDSSGKEAPSGYYAIIINGKTTTHVSLMR
jgi:internalin A